MSLHSLAVSSSLSGALISSFSAVLFLAPAPVMARCGNGFTVPPGYNYCVPANIADRQKWQACADESRNLGLPNITQLGESRRVKIIDKFIYYCRTSKLPHLY